MRSLNLHQNFGQPEAKGIAKTIRLPDPEEAFSVALDGHRCRINVPAVLGVFRRAATAESIPVTPKAPTAGRNAQLLLSKRSVTRWRNGDRLHHHVRIELLDSTGVEPEDTMRC